MDRKEAIEVVRKNWPDSSRTMLREALETLIPELVESEDEKIRKDLIRWVNTNISYERMPVGMNYSNECVLAWLEKQGEQKSSWSEEDEIGYNDALFAIEKARLVAKDENDMGNLWFAEKWLKSLKGNRVVKKKIEKQDESKDEKIRKELIEYIKGQKITPNNPVTDEWIAWLEKQGKLKSNWSENDEKIRNELLPIIRRYIGYIEEESCEPHLKDFFIKEAEEVIDWLEEQVKQKSEWSTVDRDTPNWIGNK